MLSPDGYSQVLVLSTGVNFRLTNRYIAKQSVSLDAEDMPPESPCALYILPAAFEEIKSHIEWRVQSADNRYEQGGILIGDVYRDPETQIVYGLVKSVIPSPISGDKTYLKFTQESWIEMHGA